MSGGVKGGALRHPLIISVMPRQGLLTPRASVWGQF